jgi:hypothetical protein
MDMRQYNQAKDVLIAVLQANPDLLTHRAPTAEGGKAVSDFAWAFIDAYVDRFQKVTPAR